MNYLAEIKAFYDRLELNPLPSPAIALWHALMSIANKTGWQQEFTVAVSVLVLKSGLNAQAIKRARNRLEQDGFITWRSRGGNQSAVYHLNSLVVQNDIKNVPQCEPQSVPQTDPQSVPQCEPQSVPINKHKQNKTKQVPPISPSDRFFESEKLNQTFLDYVDFRKKMKKPMTDRAIQLAVGKLKTLASGSGEFREEEAIEILNNSILNGWQGLFPLKNTGEKKNINKFNNFPQRDYDMDSLEAQLLGGKKEVEKNADDR